MRRNRVTPFGTIEALPQRGALMGNRGALYGGGDGDGDGGGLARAWSGRRWIACVLSYKGWRSPPWGATGRWTALFFLDEAVALAAGHRPCALCRRADYERWRDAWVAAHGGARPSADAMDGRLHADRLDGRAQRRHRRLWASLPDGTYVALDDRPVVVAGDVLRVWTPAGYAPETVARPRRGDATVLTPSCTVDVLIAGYVPAASEPVVG